MSAPNGVAAEGPNGMSGATGGNPVAIGANGGGVAAEADGASEAEARSPVHMLEEVD